MDYKKLADVTEFTPTKVWGFTWKFWDKENKKMLMSKEYVKGYHKEYTVECGDWKMGLSEGQVKQMLEACLYNGKAEPEGKTFSVKRTVKQLDNGEEKVNYYINLVRDAKPVRPAEPLGDAAQQFNESQNNDGLPF